jgi:proteasome lid subunit RPN8/RPN11
VDPLTAPPFLKIRSEHWEKMRAAVAREVPREACGLVAGKDRISIEVIPVANALRSPVRFRMEPAEQLDALNRIDEMGWDLLAIYHSHPNGPPFPSETDIAEAFYPEAISLILSRSDTDWSCRGYIIRNSAAIEVPVHILSPE